MLTRVAARLHEERGFTIVEAIVSITILAIGGIAVTQSLVLGLRTSGASRERLSARSVVDQQMELARALNYDSLVLDDAAPLAGSTDTSNPDHWVDEDAQTYDHDGAGGDPPEPIVRVAGASPSLHHIQTPIVQGNTTFSIYVYVTWVDSPTDGVGGADKADGNGDGVDDSGGQDTKRTTIVTVWHDSIGGGAIRQLSASSLFAVQEIFYQDGTGGTPANQPPSVGCPTASSSGLTVTFTSSATDSDGTISSVTWDFGDGQTGTGSSATHSYASAGTYTIVNTATDDDGDTGTNAGQGCTVTTTEPSVGPGPNGTVTIASGATYTTQTIVTLSLNNPSGTAVQMQFSSDGSSWSTPIAYNTSTIFTLPSGDGTKTVYARFIDGTGTTGSNALDTIILDTTPPEAPTSLAASSMSSGSEKTVTLTWTPPVPAPFDLAGYQVWKRLTSGTTWTQVASCTAGTSCVDTYKKQDSYEFYVVAVDNAGNISAESNHVTK
jgi:type II secretory pathway pseudopilin PulG